MESILHSLDSLPTRKALNYRSQGTIQGTVFRRQVGWERPRHLEGKGKEATERLVSPLFVNPVLGSWHIISFTPYNYSWDRCDFWHFSGWETEAQRSYTTSICVHLITNKEVSKSLKPKLWGLINPKPVVPLTPQPTGKVPEACGGGKGKERRWESSYYWRKRRGSEKVLKYVWACYILPGMGSRWKHCHSDSLSIDFKPVLDERQLYPASM